MIDMKREQEILIKITKSILEQKDLELDNTIIKALDWEYLLQISLRHKVFPIVYKAISKYIPIKYQAFYDQKYYDIVKKINIRMLELDRILKLAEQNNIEVILLKGPALAEIIYNDIYIRQFVDIDLLVKEADMEKMYYLLNSIGYLQKISFDKNTNRYNTVDKPIFKYGSDFHEFQCIKDIGDNIYIFVEIKRASSAIPLKHIGDFLENVQSISINGIDIKTLNLTYTFLHLCSNFFTNFETEWGVNHETNLRDILDTCMFISKHGDFLNWTEINSLSNKYEIAHKIYYVLKCMTGMVGKVISNEIIESFNPNKVTYYFNGNSDGSINAWESDFVFRLFNDKERKREFVKLTKLKIYNARNYDNHDKVEKESFATLTNVKTYRHFFIESLQWDIEYMFTCDNTSLYLNVIIDNNIYEQLGNYYLFVLFIDNNLDNAIPSRTITITKDESLQVQFVNLQQCSWQFVELGNKRLIKVLIPFECLDMNFKDSDNRIFHNIEFREKIGCDGFRTIGGKYEPIFLKI
ncbi:nucleotidyltransferase domain-containing protein [Mahella australiensis]|uniref:Nucleotidyltransferase family protein n=1 Tax=Mahella australiensis (strain DSM 15567 / CIP 107919 / 50-1 BON) TaxID=697281 RepID=F3ZXH7_MAHA5|nr:nucleotidyltransferase family protein [Mahella australiensis]AEE97658.1 hypothetical protein Mahau_2501 [Mahella australiensis 50-1 BON]